MLNITMNQAKQGCPAPVGSWRAGMQQ